MIELLNKYNKDLGTKIPESLLLIDKYENLFKKVEELKRLKINDNSKYNKYK